MAYNFQPFKAATEATFEWLKSEFTGLRTGRATPSILDVITVTAYGGTRMQIRELATVSVEDPRTLRLSPWDKSVIKDVDSAIRESNLGLSVAVDGDGIRVSFPELTADRRLSLIKVAKEKLEEARIRIRNERQRALGEIDRGETGDDDKARSKTELQKLVDDANAKLEDLTAKKEKEISE
ncbi:MAG: Frr, ribosome recycling factor [Parcubacteria group bacterium]|nr:Frr, ribosome recycling factor [Parcubacteria group bacterium]